VRIAKFARQLLDVVGHRRGAEVEAPEQLREEAVVDAAPGEVELALLEQVQEQAYEQVLYLPLGQYVEIAIYGDHLEGVLEGPAPIFWNIRKND
jgi:peptide/nickel transport system substrate-binding protein